MRLIFSAVCIICLTLASCNNGEVKSSDAVPGEEQQLKALIAQYPDSLLLKENLVEYLRKNSDYDKAISETQIALNKDSLNPHLLSIKATLHFENGDTATAIKTFEKAISISPQPEYIMLLGSIYAQTKNPAAIKMANALLWANAIDARKEALFIKGLYYNYSGNKIKAIPFFDSCIKIDYRYMFAYREKAICLYDLNKFTDALGVLQQAVTVQNNFEEAYYWTGRCYEKLDKKKDAIDNYQVALKLDAGYVEAKEALERLR